MTAGLLLALATGVASAGQITVSLEAAPKPLGRPPYARAILNVQNAGANAIQAISLQEARGGPTFVYDLLVPPGTTRSARIDLLASSVHQSYDVRSLAGKDHNSGTLAEERAGISWAEDLVEKAGRHLIDPALHGRWEHDVATWPPVLLQNMILAALLICLTAAATFFLRSVRFRAAMILIVVAGGTCAVVWLLRSQPTVLMRELETDVGAPGQRDRQRPLIVLTARRTTKWSHSADDFIPVYPTVSAMTDDDVVIHPGRGMTLILYPGQVRLFKRSRLPGQSGPGSSASSPSASSS